MRAHQPGSTPIDIPETVPNPAYTPAPAPAPERAPTKMPEKVPEKVIASESSGFEIGGGVIWTTERSDFPCVVGRWNALGPRMLGGSDG